MSEHRCPFCAVTELTRTQQLLTTRAQVECLGCGALGPACDTEVEALDAFCRPAHAPGIDRERLVEALREALSVRADMVILPVTERNRIEWLADAILRHLGQPVAAPKPAGEVCRWTWSRGTMAWSLECGHSLLETPATPRGECPGCGRRVEVVE